MSEDAGTGNVSDDTTRAAGDYRALVRSSLDDPEVFWVEPKMRAILPLDGLHVSRSLAKKIRKDHFQVTCNAAFDRVIEECARPRIDHPDSWISARIMASYRALHEEGHAHSIECWRAGDETPELVGGLYGVQFGGVFCGESMFSRADDASKVALAWLVVALALALWRACVAAPVDRALAISVTAALVGLALQGLVDYTVRSNIVAAIVALLAGCGVALSRPPRAAPKR